VSEPFSSSDRLWRILVIGNSVTTTVPGRASRLQGPYPELLEARLRAEGVNAEVRNAGREFDLIHRGVYRYHEEERTWCPDVLVVHYGMAEAQAPVIPHGVYNHFMTWNKGLRKPASVYRGRFAPGLWRRLRAFQRWAHPKVPMRITRMSRRRFAGELERVIQMARHEHRLVLVVDINPPGPRILHNLPRLDERRDVFQQILKDVVQRASANDDDVRLIEASVLCDEFGIDETLPDGYHWSSAAHERVAEMMAAEILQWIKGF
jgi:lysophospholipase L1-like esterase